MNHPERTTSRLRSPEFTAGKQTGERLFESVAKVEKINPLAGAFSLSGDTNRTHRAFGAPLGRGSRKENESRASKIALVNILIGILMIAAPITVGVVSIPVAWEQFGGLGIIGVGILALWVFLGCLNMIFKNLKKIGDLTKD